MTNISGIVKSARKIMRQDTGTGSDELRILQLGWMLFLKVFSDKDKELELINDDYASPIPAELHWDQWAGDDEGMTGDELLEFVDRKLFPTLSELDLSTGNKRAVLVRDVFENNFNYMKSGIHLRQVINKLNEINFNNSKDKHLFGEIYEKFLGELQSAGTLGEFYTPRAITQLLTELTDPEHGEKVLDPSCGTGGYLTATIEHLKANSSSVEERTAIQENVRGWEYKPLPHLLANTNLILHDINLPNIRFGDSLERPLSEYTQKDRVDIILANPPFGGVVSNNNENNFPQNYRTKESADLFLILMIHLLKDGGRAAIVLPEGSLSGEGVKARIRKKLLEDCDLHTIVKLPSSVFEPYASATTNLLFFQKGKKTKKVWYYEHLLPEGYKAYSKTKPIKIEEFKEFKEWWNNKRTTDHAWQVDIKEIIDRDYDLAIENPIKAKKEDVNTEELYKKYTKSNDQISFLIKEVISETINQNSIVSDILEKDISLFKNASVIRQLKQEIMYEAIQGKITSQWRVDKKLTDSAQTLIKEAKKIKDKLIQEKEIRRPKSTLPIQEKDIPFQIPESWSWCRVGDIGVISRGKSPQYAPKSSATILNQKCVRWFKIELEHSKNISEEWSSSLPNFIRTRRNDVLINSTGEGTIGRSAIVEDTSEGLLFDSHVLRLRTEVDPMYITSLINSDFGQKQINSLKGAKTTKQTELGVNNLSNILIPLAPKEEQKEIVLKLKSLLTKCDKIHECISISNQYSEKLMKNLLQEAFTEPERNKQLKECA